MKPIFITYRQFKNLEEAEAIIHALETNDIEYLTEDLHSSLDSNFLGTGYENKVSIKLRSSDFKKIDGILNKEAEKTLMKMEGGHYLLSFSVAELYDIVDKSDEWSHLDFQIAKNILKSKGHNMSSEELVRRKRKRLDDLRKPINGKINWILSGVLGGGFGGIFAILHGWNYMTLKKILPNGERTYVYDLQTRKSASYVFYGGIVATIIWIFILARSIGKMSYY